MLVFATQHNDIGYALYRLHPRQNLPVGDGSQLHWANAVRDDSDISKVVDVYRNKLRMIKQLAPTSKIFVVPVLPTRNARMNRNITRFNCLLSEMLSTCFRDIYFPGVYSFLDSKNLLSNRLTRENDDIHLGEKGIAQFVRLLKLWIFECDARERRLGRNSSRAPQKADPAGST